MSVEAAESRMRHALDNREQRFLELARRAIFANTASPYLPLLTWAGCEYGDLERSVRADGLEGALHKLRASDVYLTLDELKGRKPIERNGLSLPVRTSQFFNPFLGSYFGGTTGGSTGKPVSIPHNLSRTVDAVAYRVLSTEAHGLRGAVQGLWRPLPPAPTGVANAIAAVIGGLKLEKWFALPVDRDLRTRIKTNAFMRGLGLAFAVAGVKFPRPQFVGVDDAAAVARWAAQRVRPSEPVEVRATVSMSTRIARAAIDSGVDLTGVWLSGGGERSSEAKAALIKSTGAGWIPAYVITEAGHIGTGCANPALADDMHLLDDVNAVIQHPRVLPGGETLEPLLFTTLSEFATMILLNVESDDCATIEERECGCILGDVGLKRHIHSVYSFGKLTGEGVTFAGTEMAQILDTLLPERFGGTPLDYQLVEEEQEGVTRLVVVVSPVVGPLNERELIDCILQGLGASNLAADIRAHWGKGDSIRVRREVPTVTGAGKVVPLRVERKAEL